VEIEMVSEREKEIDEKLTELASQINTKANAAGTAEPEAGEQMHNVSLGPASAEADPEAPSRNHFRCAPQKLRGNSIT
jgi:hypothetical protein